MSEVKRPGRPSRKSQYIHEVRRLYLDEKHSLGEIAEIIPVSIQTISRWLQDDGVVLEVRKRSANAGRTPEQQAEINSRISETRLTNLKSGATKAGGRKKGPTPEPRECPSCRETFQPKTKTQRFCTVQCARQADANAKRAATERAWYESDRSLCACGANRIPYVHRDTWKFCSAECRNQYGGKRAPDPANYVTFDCDTCGTSTTRRKKYGSSISGKRFCSNACATKHTKVVRHYVCHESDMVLDSTWEMLFAGLMGFRKIPCERYDRDRAVEWAPGHWYAPDFLVAIDGLQIAVEIKGQADPDDPVKWTAYSDAHGPLVVLGETHLDDLCSSTPLETRRSLYVWATQTDPA